MEHTGSFGDGKGKAKYAVPSNDRAWVKSLFLVQLGINQIPSFGSWC